MKCTREGTATLFTRLSGLYTYNTVLLQQGDQTTGVRTLGTLTTALAVFDLDSLQGSTRSL